MTRLIAIARGGCRSSVPFTELLALRRLEPTSARMITTARVTSDCPSFQSRESLPPILTVEELADILRIDRKTAYAAISEGGVPGVRRIGRCIRISRDVVLDWLDSGRGHERMRGRAS